MLRAPPHGTSDRRTAASSPSPVGWVTGWLDRPPGWLDGEIRRSLVSRGGTPGTTAGRRDARQATVDVKWPGRDRRLASRRERERLPRPPRPRMRPIGISSEGASRQGGPDMPPGRIEARKGSRVAGDRGPGQGAGPAPAGDHTPPHPTPPDHPRGPSTPPGPSGHRAPRHRRLDSRSGPLDVPRYHAREPVPDRRPGVSVPSPDDDRRRAPPGPTPSPHRRRRDGATLAR
jgi:hypothetical protein